MTVMSHSLCVCRHYETTKKYHRNCNSLVQMLLSMLKGQKLKAASGKALTCWHM